MNELTTFYGQIAEQSEARDKARAVYALCRFITPQFYSKQTRDEAAATVSSIQVLTADIDGAVMAKMCEMAAKDYPKARSENPKVFFDINYILTFYKKAAGKPAASVGASVSRRGKRREALGRCRRMERGQRIQRENLQTKLLKIVDI